MKTPAAMSAATGHDRDFCMFPSNGA
jgi:hypothetical protein